MSPSGLQMSGFWQCFCWARKAAGTEMHLTFPCYIVERHDKGSEKKIVLSFSQRAEI